MPRNPPRPWTGADTRTLKALHSEGLSLGKIAKQMGRSRSTINDRAKRNGLGFDRTRTKAAAEARRIDAAALRAELKVKLLEDAERLRGQLFTRTKVFNFGGKDNTYREHVLEQPPADMQRATMAAIGIAVSKSIDLEKIDQKQDNNTPAFDQYLATLGVGQIGGTR